jgi:hypothetical protein
MQAHQIRMWSGRVAWVAGLAVAFVVLRVSVFEFSGQEGPGSCPNVALRSYVTLWHAHDLCARKAVGWLLAGRAALVVSFASIACWRVAYRRDTVPE